MNTKQELINQCDDGIKKNKLAVKINSFFAGVNFFLAWAYASLAVESMMLFHIALLALHVALAYGAVKLREKWESMKNDLIKHP